MEIQELNVTPGEVNALKSGEKFVYRGTEKFGYVMLEDLTSDTGVSSNVGVYNPNEKTGALLAVSPNGYGHLFAASKELYEALVIAREYASEEIARRQNAGMDTSLDVGYLKQIDAALAKARGEA